MYFKILLKKSLQERCIPSTAHAVSSNVIDILLLRFHVLNILIQTNHIILTLGREEPKQWCKTLVVFTIFHASQFQMFSKILPKCLIILQCKQMLSIQKKNGIRHWSIHVCSPNEKIKSTISPALFKSVFTANILASHIRDGEGKGGRDEERKKKYDPYSFIFTHWYSQNHVKGFSDQTFPHDSHLQEQHRVIVRRMLTKKNKLLFQYLTRLLGKKIVTRTMRLSWRISRETLSGRSFESTTPLTKLRYRGNYSTKNTKRCTQVRLHFNQLYSSCIKGRHLITNSPSKSSEMKTLLTWSLIFFVLGLIMSSLPIGETAGT